MNASLLPVWSALRVKPVVGMLHLPALPGAPRFDGDFSGVLEFVLRDAQALAEGGVHGLMLENFGDVPFTAGRVAAYVATHMARVALEVRRRFSLPLGINVLRNDGRTALAIAAAVRADFIRVNVLSGARVTDQGVIQGCAYRLLRERALLRAEHIKIFADVNVKHSAPLGPARPVEDEVADLVERAGADALIVTGSATGQPTDAQELARVKAVAGSTPVFVGSGVTAETIASYADMADGFIVGTSLKQGGGVGAPVDPARVRDLVSRLA